MDPWRPVQRSFYNYWGEGQGYLDILVLSAPTVVKRQGVGRAHVVLYQQNRCFLIRAPAIVNNEGFLTAPIRESWIEDLQAFNSFEQTVAGLAIAAHIRSVPYLRDFVQGCFISVIASEARDAARTAVSLQHRAVWMVVVLNITIHFSYGSVGDDHNAGDDDDDGSYLDEMDTEGRDAEVDTVALEEVGVDAEVQQLAAPGADAEVQQLAAPEGVVGDAAVMEAGNGDIMVVGILQEIQRSMLTWKLTLLTRILGQPVGPLLSERCGVYPLRRLHII